MDIDITRDEMWILITWGREEEERKRKEENCQ